MRAGASGNWSSATMSAGPTSHQKHLNGAQAAPNIVVANAQMRDLLAFAERAAASHAKVLITGESGTGKDLIARYVHTKSSRGQSEYVAVNCAGVTESL